jgi:hypothetical protein
LVETNSSKVSSQDDPTRSLPDQENRRSGDILFPTLSRR